MTYAMEDYYPPLDGHLDDRRLAMFADNRGLTWGFHSEKSSGGVKLLVTLGDQTFEADHEDAQTALDAAIDKAVASVGA